MSSGAQKTSLARSLEIFASRKAFSATSQLGQALPASVVSIASPGTVIIKFEITNTVYTLDNIEVPVVGSQWVRLPIQPGTLGYCMTASAYLGGMSGIGGGAADLVPRGNLGMLVWTPIGNRNWTPSTDSNALDLNGPDGVIIRDTNSLCRIVIKPTGMDLYPPLAGVATVHGNLAITGNLILGGTIEGTGATPYAGEISTAGAIIAGKGGVDQVSVQTHNHEYDKPSSGGTTPTPTTSPNAGT